MKYLFTILFISFLYYPLAQTKFPDYTEVHKQYYTRYDDINAGEIIYSSFEKRVDGWYVQYSTKEDYKNKKSIKFWDKKTNKWLDLGFHKTTAQYQPINERRIPYMYRVSPMYGYSGWYKDVINTLGNEKNLTDTLLYALTKAYFNHFTSSFGNQYGDFLKEDLLSSGTFPNTFNADQLTEVKRRFDKVQETTKRMIKQNPMFETFIGSLSIQYGNDQMDAFMRLYIYQNPEEAKKYMSTGLYDQYVIDFAKYLLSSCPPNAILITNGDNDTYPLWYVQYGLSYRTDVSVINASLLTYSDYAIQVRKLGLVDFTTPDATIKNEFAEYALIDQNNKKLGFSNLQNFMSQDFNEIKTLESGTFTFTVNGKDCDVLAKSYIYRGELLILDIIYTNLGKRPICFTSIDSKFNPLVPEYRFHYTPIRTVGFTGQDHANSLLNIWDNNFILSDYSSVTEHFSAQHNRLVNSMIYDISMKCSFLIEAGKKTEAGLIIRKVEKTFSSPQIKRDIMWMYVAAIFGKLGEKKMAEDIMDQAIKTEKQETLLDPMNQTQVINLERSKQMVIDGSFTF